MKRSNISHTAPQAGILSWESPLGMDTGNNNPGIICAANESRFVEAYFSEPLTTYAVGWKDPGQLEALLEFLAPKVPVSPRFEFAQANNAEEFIAESGADDIRAIGSDFKRVEYTSSKVNSRTYNKGLTIRVDLDQVAEQPNWRQTYTGKLMRRLLRAEIRRAFALLAAAATNTAIKWTGTPGASSCSLDPDQDVIDRVIAFGDAVGMNPTRLLYGLGEWANRRSNFRKQNTAGAFASAAMTVQEVAEQVGCREGFVSQERYTSSATAKTRFVSGVVLAFLAEAGQTPEDPSNIKRFVSNTTGGTQFRVYEQQISMKLVDITVEHYSNIVVTSTLGVQKLTVS